MSNKILTHLPWIVPAVAIAVVGSGVLEKANISLGGDGSTLPALETADGGATDGGATDAITTEPATPAQAAVAAVVETPAVAADAPVNVSDQLAALLVEEATGAGDVDVSRTTGFSIDVLETATEAALDEGNVLNGDVMAAAVVAQPVIPEAAPAAAESATAEPTPTEPDAVGADFFATAQANLAAANSCVTDLRNLASQAKVYFPSGALTGEASGIAQARLIGTIAARCQGVSIEVQGHSDPSGDPAINLRLSEERAQSVIARISAAGIDTSKFFAVGLGSAQPSGVAGIEQDAYYDRRVEFAVIETTQEASLGTRGFSPNAASAACVLSLRNAVEQTRIAYAPGSVTMSQQDFTAALQLAQMAAACPQARLRVIGHHADQVGSVEDSATGRLRANALATTLVGAGVDAGQIITAAPGYSVPVSGLTNSRVDFDVILEEG